MMAMLSPRQGKSDGTMHLPPTMLSLTLIATVELAPLPAALIPQLPPLSQMIPLPMSFMHLANPQLRLTLYQEYRTHH